MKKLLGFKKSDFKHSRSELFLVISLVLLSACSTKGLDNGGTQVAGATTTPKNSLSKMIFPNAGHIDFDISQGLRIYNNAKIYVSDLQVNVAASRTLEKKPKALFLPLGLVQSNLDPNGISYGVSRLLWQQFLAEQTFSTLELSDTSPPYRLEYAIEGAKAQGAEFLVGGYITHFIDGASVGDSKIAVQLEIYDTESGSLLWVISQSGVLPYKTDKDNIFFTVHNRMPIDSMSALVSAIGADLARYLHYWTDPEAMKDKDSENNLMEKLEPSAF